MNDAEYLISCLSERLDIDCPETVSEKEQFNIFRSLCSKTGENIPDDEYFYEVQDRYLQSINKKQTLTDIKSLTPVSPRLYVSKSPATALIADAVVNAAGERMIGYRSPCFDCIQSDLFFRAGLQLKKELTETTRLSQAESSRSSTVITMAYNLPAKYIIHPRTLSCRRPVQNLNAEDISQSYRNCLHLAWLNGVSSIAFCLTLSGLSQFTKFAVASIAASAVKEWLFENPNYDIKILFNGLDDEDTDIFNEMLKKA